MLSPCGDTWPKKFQGPPLLSTIACMSGPGVYIGESAASSANVRVPLPGSGSGPDTLKAAAVAWPPPAGQHSLKKVIRLHSVVTFSVLFFMPQKLGKKVAIHLLNVTGDSPTNMYCWWSIMPPCIEWLLLRTKWENKMIIFRKNRYVGIILLQFQSPIPCNQPWRTIIDQQNRWCLLENFSKDVTCITLYITFILQ